MAINQLPQTPNVGDEVPQSLWKWLIEMGNRMRALISQANSNTRLVSAPASATASGSPGDIAFDADYVYMCVATDTWKRASLGSWS